ncbi:unnamed protein product [Orchesella dallaii]|uniref:Uncharacterized protein n=1 Tax=Orchesella dallaii TaxID=48710 RepID=A0ABP1RUR2_9HEXA
MDQKCEYGFSDVSFKAIEQQFLKRGRRDRQGILIFDELQLRETMDFNRRQMKFTGFVDYGDCSSEAMLEAEKGKRANHAVVLMYRPFNYSWFLGNTLRYSYSEKRFKTDQDRLGGLRKCPKLSSSHIWPNSFEKMIVSLATQMLVKFSDILAMEMNCLNAKKGRKLESPSFATKETVGALRVTVKSTLEIIVFLVNDLGFVYVLTAKLNQDYLEKFFGLIRASGGREDHPTITNSIQLYRLLTIYTLAKRALRLSRF